MRSWIVLVGILSLAPACVKAEAERDGFEGIVTLNMTAVERPYADAGTDRSFAPLVIGQWGNVFFAGDRLLVGLHDGGWWTLAAMGQLRFHQYQRPDRDRAIDAGLVATVPYGGYMLQAAMMHDVTDTHRGVETELRAFRSWTLGLATLVPAVAVQHQSARLAGYYFGTPEYAPGRTTNLAGELTVIVTVNEPWVASATWRHVHHGGSIAASPVATGRATTTWTVGLGRRF